MNALADRIVLAWGWRRLALAFGAGAIGALAMPPFGILPAMAIALTAAVWLIDGAAAGGRFRSALFAAVAGWWWGFGYFLAGLWWLGSAFLVEADQFAWALPLGVVGLPAGLAFFFAVAFGAARLLWLPGARRIVLFALIVALTEFLRGVIFTGFPWNSLGMALGQNLWLMQVASITGLDGLTLLTALICSAPASLGTGRTPRERWRPVAFGALALAIIAAFGALRLPAQPSPTVAGVKLRIMQPNLPQDAKFRPENREEIMRRYLDISDRATSPTATGVADATHLFWPESAFPFLLHRDARALAQIAALLPAGVTLITGAARVDDPLPGEEGHRYFNSIHVIRDDGTIVGTYDKVHLVPFGEYLPALFDRAMRAIGVRQFVHVPGGFTPADHRAALAIPGLPGAAATVCYEAIFSGAFIPEGPRPGLIVNVTNDAWFGDTPGPRQHFAQARLRSVEEGLPLVRAANTGISAVVDPYGRVVASLPLGIEGVLDAPLPSALSLTIFARFRIGFFLIAVICCITFLLTLGVPREHA